jgi:hypothetical protein
MIKEVHHIYEHFDFSTFPEGEAAKEKMGTMFTSSDLVVYYDDYAISFEQIWRIINSKKNNIITFNDFKKGW